MFNILFHFSLFAAIKATPSQDGYDLGYHDHFHHQDLANYDYYAVQISNPIAIPAVERYFNIRYIERAFSFEEWFFFCAEKSISGPFHVQERFAKLNASYSDYRLSNGLVELKNIVHQVPRSRSHRSR
ncbi:hypothetical protein DSO57_1009920 [Entomophthora muscae]|uniref:Uncharacterized protein n=1 Tax=Entomophthora muscae TaxID=34485 RepID=A0ACC2SWA8_9FUNG|nr:hypothetical protein DSO57_1009920 [Entomophthora muscae]